MVINDFFVQLIALFLSAVTAFLIKKVTDYLNTKATKEERDDILFWTELAVKVMEELYREKGQGVLKKEEVVKFLRANNFNISDSQMDVLIDAVVSQLNDKGWKTTLY